MVTGSVSDAIEIAQDIPLTASAPTIANNWEAFMGSTEDPKDGGAVAGAVFGAVFIYIVCAIHLCGWNDMLTNPRASLSSAASRPSSTSEKAAVAR